MAGRKPSERSVITQARASVLSTAFELFACEYANGLSPKDAAEIAGYNPDYGYKLIQMPQILQRVEELVALRAAQGPATQAWIEAQMINIVRISLHGAPEIKDAMGNIKEGFLPRNLPLAGQTLMNLSRLKGYIVEKKQVANTQLDLSKLAPAQLRSALNGHLDNLSPGARERIAGILSNGIDSGSAAPVIEVKAEPNEDE